MYKHTHACTRAHAQTFIARLTCSSLMSQAKEREYKATAVSCKHMLMEFLLFNLGILISVLPRSTPVFNFVIFMP